MPLLPKLGETKETEHWTQAENLSYVITSYLIILAFGIGIILAISNLVNFILTEKRQRTDVSKCRIFHPMLSFYLWIVLDFLANMVRVTFTVRNSDYPMIQIAYLPCTFKILIGIEQIWLMIELIAQINLATNFLKSTGSTLIGDNLSDYLKTNQSFKVSKQNVKVGRYFVTMISVMYLMATILLCNLFEPESDGQWGS